MVDCVSVFGISFSAMVVHVNEGTCEFLLLELINLLVYNIQINPHLVILLLPLSLIIWFSFLFRNFFVNLIMPCSFLWQFLCSWHVRHCCEALSFDEMGNIMCCIWDYNSELVFSVTLAMLVTVVIYVVVTLSTEAHSL